jgi:hypothetical protein
MDIKMTMPNSNVQSYNNDDVIIGGGLVQQRRDLD